MTATASVRRRLALAALATCAACTGSIDPPGAPAPASPVEPSRPSGAGGARGGDDLFPPATPGLGGSVTPPATPPPAGTPLVASRAAIRRLTESELRTTMMDLLGFDLGADVEVWPEDARTPFDNEYGTQFASRALVEAAKSIAEKGTARVLADATARQRIVGCTPTGVSDAACLRQFVTRFGRRALRRPLSSDEVDRYAAFVTHNAATGDFYTAVGMVLRALLQDVELVYRIELGTPVTGDANLFKLNDFEVASRLSYLLWGSAPDDALLDSAAAKTLGTVAGVRAAAARLLGAKRARDRIGRFHALWLGYERSSLPATLEARMQQESRALIEKVLFDDKAPWLALFSSKETFIDDTLAKHYGLPSPGAAAKWVPYGATGRQGLLSHGTFLSVAAKFNDTSPTQRGKLIRERLLCQIIPLPDPAMMVNVDEPPGGDAKCKYDRYVAHRQGGCAGCHSLMDPVGFGLENYDSVGKYRATEPGLPECTIAGQGELVGVGAFRGPGELAKVLLASGGLESCAVTQLYRFAAGRSELTADDERFVDELTRRFRANGNRFDELLLDYASQPAFGFRIVE